MKMFRNVKTSVKILGLIMMMAFFLAIVGYAGHYATGKLAVSVDDMYQNRLLPVQWTNSVKAEGKINEVLTLSVFLSQDSAKQQEYLQQINEHKAIVLKLLTNYSESQLDAFEKEALEKVMSETKAYRSEWQKSLDLATSGRQAEGYAYFTNNAASHLAAVNKELDALAEHSGQLATAENTKSKQLAVESDRIVIVVTGAAVILALVIGWLISRLIAGPLAELVNKVQRLADGNLSGNQSAEEYIDEVGQLSKEINVMADNLRQLVKHIRHTAEDLSASSQQLTAGAEQAAQATGQVTTAIGDVAEGAEQQSGAINETAAVVVGMSTAIEQIAGNANLVTGDVAKTVAAAEKGATSARAVTSQMDSIEKTVSSSAQAVIKLGDRSKEIGQIVDTISGIAGQTNLLALNAAIEAARAGEQGKGFAVVAEEVRKLAEQSKEAASQIADMIGDIQAETARAVSSMEAGSREVRMGAEVVSGAGQSFTEIAALVNHVSSQVTEISAAIGQLSAGSRQIVSSMKNIDEISKKSVGRTQTVSAATEEHAASVEEIVASSQALAGMAGKLQAEVNKFQVD
ncbi:MAG: methyl-accepting chemotaxis protein [Pelosinus sp.]|nr:methyl-accepting chemotaxis protein [Pelosinus sp.]